MQRNTRKLLSPPLYVGLRKLGATRNVLPASHRDTDLWQGRSPKFEGSSYQSAKGVVEMLVHIREVQKVVPMHDDKKKKHISTLVPPASTVSTEDKYKF